MSILDEIYTKIVNWQFELLLHVSTRKMSNKVGWDEILIDQKVTYTLEMYGKLFLIKNVPARINVETGEQFFSPKTVDRLQQIVWNQQQPVRTVTLPVYEYTN